MPKLQPSGHIAASRFFNAGGKLLWHKSCVTIIGVDMAARPSPGQPGGKAPLGIYSVECHRLVNLYLSRVLSNPEKQARKYLISGGTGGEVPPFISSCSKRKVKS